MFAYGHDGPVMAFDGAIDRAGPQSLVFSIDNLLDGFGLVPVLKEAYGDRLWCVIACGCVAAGRITCEGDFRAEAMVVATLLRSP